VINTIGNQVLSGAGRVATTYVANGFTTNGMGWQQILRSAFGIPQATTPGATAGTVGTSVSKGTPGNGAWKSRSIRVPVTTKDEASLNVVNSLRLGKPPRKRGGFLFLKSRISRYFADGAPGGVLGLTGIWERGNLVQP